MRVVLSAATALLLLSSPAPAADIALHWDDCAPAGASLRAFACGTNTGADLLIGSFIPPAGVTDFIAMEATMQVLFPSGTALPDWWNVPACRPAAVFTPTVDFGFGPCESPWSPNAAGGYAYSPTFYTPSSGRLRVVFAAPPQDARALDSNTEYYAFRLSVGRSKTTGAGACAGCEVPAGIYLRSIRIEQQTGTDFTLFPVAGQELEHSYYASWQCDGIPRIVDDASFQVINCGVPAKRPTWGTIKGLYR